MITSIIACAKEKYYIDSFCFDAKKIELIEPEKQDRKDKEIILKYNCVCAKDKKSCL